MSFNTPPFLKKNEPFLLQNTSNFTHELLYDNFNNKFCYPANFLFYLLQSDYVRPKQKKNVIKKNIYQTYLCIKISPFLCFGNIVVGTIKIGFYNNFIQEHFN